VFVQHLRRVYWHLCHWSTEEATADSKHETWKPAKISEEFLLDPTTKARVDHTEAVIAYLQPLLESERLLCGSNRGYILVGLGPCAMPENNSRRATALLQREAIRAYSVVQSQEIGGVA
jgi:hypothetical protein